MQLLIFYVVLMIVGDFAAYLIGLVVEHYWPAASLTIFLALYFLFLWIAWIIAVWLTEPRAATAEPTSGASKSGPAPDGP